jgi:hypothetical protein
VRKHFIQDGPVLGTETIPWRKEAGAGESITLGCKTPGTFGNALIGESRDSFSVTVQLHASLSKDYAEEGVVQRIGRTGESVRRTGYNELHHALWMVHKSLPCEHQRLRNQKKVVLDPGCLAISGFNPAYYKEPLRKLIINLTADNTVARWRALLSFLSLQGEGFDYFPVFLRGEDCCLQCAIDQAFQELGGSYLVL